MKTKAMIFREVKQPMVLEELEIPALHEGEVLVRLLASGVCGSDVHIWKGEDPRAPRNMIIGHEGVGEIVEMKGKKYSVDGEELHVGDHIIWDRGHMCGKCYACKVLRQPALCSDRKVYGLNQSLSDYPYINGCYSEYLILMDGMDIFKIDADMDPALMVTAACSGATVCHGFDLHRPKVGDTVVIVGCGPLGIYATLLARLSGAGKIIVTGTTPRRLQFCQEVGADVIININEMPLKQRHELILEMTHGRGADFCIESVGYPDALGEALDHAGMGATVLSYGFGQPMGTLNFDPHFQMARKNLCIQGVWVSDTSHTHQAMTLVQNHPDIFRRMVTHRFPLSQANEAIAVMSSEEAIKAVLLPTQL